jgi:probable F420-dependent oxidoreductase
VLLDTQLTRPLDQVRAEAAALAEAGLDGCFTFEGPADVFFPLVLAAEHGGLDLYPNLAIAFPRSPMHLAHQAWDLQGLSGGRFALGLGTQVRPHVERRYGATWDRPVERMQELVEAVRAVFACWQDGERLDFRGDHYELTLMTPVFDPGPLEVGPPPIWVGALGPRMTRMVAGTADGLLLHPFSTRTFLDDHTRPLVAEGLRSAGRDRDDLTIVGEAIVCAYRDEAEREVAEAGTRWLLAFYGSTPAYRPVLESIGHGGLQPELNTLSKQGRWAEMAALIDRPVLEGIAVTGTPTEVGGRLRERFAGVVDRLGFYLPYQPAAGLLADVVAGTRSAT